MKRRRSHRLVLMTAYVLGAICGIVVMLATMPARIINGIKLRRR